MSSKKSLCLLLEQDAFYLLLGGKCVAQRAVADPHSDHLREVAEAVSSNGGKKTLSIAIGSSLILPVPYQPPVTGHPSIDSLKYELEEFVPYDAESMAVATTGDKEQMLALIVERDRIGKLMEALQDSHGIKTDIVACAMPVLAEHLIAEKLIKPNSGMICVGPIKTDVFVLNAGKIIQWRLESSDQIVDHVANQSSAFFGDAPIYLLGAGHENETDQGWGRLSNCERIEENVVGGIHEGLARAVDAVRSHSHDSAFELSNQFDFTSPLSTALSHAWERLAVSALILLLCCTGGLLYRSIQWKAMAEQDDYAIRKEYRALFPGSRIRGSVEKLLKNQLTQARQRNQLVKLSNQSADLLSNLQRFLKAVPAETNLTTLRVSSDGVTLAGQVVELNDLDVLKDGLVESGFVLQPSVYAKQFNLSAIPDGSAASEAGQ